ncbi:hypothetical protein BDF19DRAFT_433739 [Syncephalis fuscata]|nr:hypothetical protein BDF19DRAFT_433739 [Syncephalis fuscata]
MELESGIGLSHSRKKQAPLQAYNEIIDLEDEDIKIKHEDTKAKIEDGLVKEENLEEGVYEVEAIIGNRNRKGRQQFLIKWKGYPDDENTWEDIENVNAEELLEDYWRNFHANGGNKKKKESSNKRRRSDVSNAEEFKLNDTPDDKSKLNSSIDSKSSINTPSSKTSLISDISYSIDWEDHVLKVETVERIANNNLLERWKQTVHHASQVHERCPLKLISFYEDHLNFTKQDPDAK